MKKAPAATVANCTLSGCYNDAKDAGLQVAKQHQQLAITCKDIALELDKSIKDVKILKTKNMENYKKWQKERDNKKLIATRAKLAYDDAVKKAETAALNYQTGKSQPGQLEKTLKKLQDAADSARAEMDSKHSQYMRSVKDCQQSQAKFEEETYTMLMQFDECERRRLTTFEDIIKKYEQAHEFLKSAAEQLSITLSKSRQTINVQQDIQAFIAEHFTGNLPEPHVEYKAKNSDVLSHFGDQGAATESASHLAEQVKINAIRNPTASGVYGGARAAAMASSTSGAAEGRAGPSASLSGGPGGASAGANAGLGFGKSISGASAAGVPTAVALYDYNSEVQGDLNFSVNQVITLIDCDPGSDWWTGSLNGVSGAFPRDYVKRTDSSPAAAVAPAAVSPAAPAAVVAPAVSASSPQPEQVMSLSSFTSSTPPSSAAPVAAPSSGPAGLRKVRALYDFTGEASDELSFSTGDILYVINELEDWLEGKDSKGQTGIFPANYVTYDV